MMQAAPASLSPCPAPRREGTRRQGCVASARQSPRGRLRIRQLLGTHGDERLPSRGRLGRPPAVVGRHPTQVGLRRHHAVVALREADGRHRRERRLPYRCGKYRVGRARHCQRLHGTSSHRRALDLPLLSGPRPRVSKPRQLRVRGRYVPQFHRLLRRRGGRFHVGFQQRRPSRGLLLKMFQ